MQQIGYLLEAATQKRFSLFKELLIILGASFLISLSVPISIQLPFTPVPITLGPQICMLFGALLGKNRGFLAVCAYLFQGAAGLPVFALGKSGILHLIGPCGGYLMGYAAAAYVVGFLFEKVSERGLLKSFGIFAIGNSVIYMLGICQLSFFVGPEAALMIGVLPFLFGDFLKLLVAARFISAGAR